MQLLGGKWEVEPVGAGLKSQVESEALPHQHNIMQYSSGFGPLV